MRKIKIGDTKIVDVAYEEQRARDREAKKHNPLEAREVYWIETIRKVTLGPDDIVVLYTDKILTEKQLEQVDQGVKRLDLPASRVILLQDGLQLGVIHKVKGRGK
jgi:hypothetical protein